MTQPQSDRQDDGLRSALKQIKIVCVDNAATTVRHDLALEFVGAIAVRALKPIITEDDGTGDPLPEDWQPPTFAPQPTRDAAEGAVGEDYDSAKILATSKRLLEKTSAARTAPPKPAPDAMRDAIIEECAKIAAGHNGISARDSRDIAKRIRALADQRPRCSICNLEDGACICAHIRPRSTPVPPADELESESMFHDRMSDEAATLRHAPVPPADGAGWPPSNANLATALRDLENKVEPCWFLIVAEAARRLSPSPAVAAEPWTPFRFVQVAFAQFKEPELRKIVKAIFENLTAAPPVRGDREAIARALYDMNPSWSNTQFSGPEPTRWCYDTPEKQLAYKQADAILSLPVQPGAGERDAFIEVCDRLGCAYDKDSFLITIENLEQRASGFDGELRQAAAHIRDMLTADSDPQSVIVPDDVDANKFIQAFEQLAAAIRGSVS